jgi:hypothetical protein
MIASNNECRPCYRTDDVLQNGSGAGKKGSEATDAEIIDCIKNTQTAQDYSAFGYNCFDWVADAIESCGMECPSSWEIKNLAEEFAPPGQKKVDTMLNPNAGGGGWW